MITRTPGVCGGDACITGTRLTVWGLVAWQKLGWKDQDIIRMYDIPSINIHTLAEVWDYACDHPEEIQRCIEENEEEI